MMKSIPSRQRILAYLQEHPGATTAQISAALHLTHADIRYHLNVLMQTGSVQTAPAHLPGVARPRGRPILAYHLRSEARPDNLPALTTALLTLLQRGSAQQTLADLAAALLESPPAQRSLTQRLGALVQQLNRWNYQARWEARAGAPALILRNCPYAAILANHPHLCRLDRLIIERATGHPARHVEQINIATGQPPACLFHVLSRETPQSAPVAP